MLLRPSGKRAPGQKSRSSPKSLHLAVLTEPYLEWILSGKKTVESRFSVHRGAPYRAIVPGDVIVLKRSSGPIMGVCTVAKVEFFELDDAVRQQLRARFGRALCAEDDEFWTARESARYATLIHIEQVFRVGPLPCAKRDRRGWVVIQESLSEQLALSGDRNGGAARGRQIERRHSAR